MSAKTPSQVNELLIQYLTEGDVDAALDLYEDEASFVSAEGVVTGKAAIRESLQGFTSFNPRFEVTPKPTVQNGDLALTGNHWSMKGVDGNGQPVEISGSSYEIVRCGADGNWRFLIDNPDAE